MKKRNSGKVLWNSKKTERKLGLKRKNLSKALEKKFKSERLNLVSLERLLLKEIMKEVVLARKTLKR